MNETLVTHLSESLIDEIVAAVGLPTTALTHTVCWHLFRNITDRLANLGASFDQIIKEMGLPAASAWALTHFCSDLQVHGSEFIPDQGPLLVVSNHPGTYDALALYANLEGHNIRSVSTVIPFLNLLPNARHHFLFTPRHDVRERMLVFRNAIKHLQSGGTVVYFGSGHRDPDPAVYPGAGRSINNWLNVFDTFFKYVKDLKLLQKNASGVVYAKWVNHPITWFRRKQIDKQRLAEFGQVITQLRKPGKLMMTPRVSIGKPFSEHDLRQVVGPDKLYPAVIERAKLLFLESSSHYGDFL